MGIGIATIAAFLLLLPGVGFIVGVNIADKNVREIVFEIRPRSAAKGAVPHQYGLGPSLRRI